MKVGGLPCGTPGVQRRGKQWTNSFMGLSSQTSGASSHTPPALCARTCDFCCACHPNRPTVLEVRAATQALKRSRSAVTWADGGYRRQGPCLQAEGGALVPDGQCSPTALILANREEDEE